MTPIQLWSLVSKNSFWDQSLDDRKKKTLCLLISWARVTDDWLNAWSVEETKLRRAGPLVFTDDSLDSNACWCGRWRGAWNLERLPGISCCVYVPHRLAIHHDQRPVDTLTPPGHHRRVELQTAPGALVADRLKSRVYQVKLMLLENQAKIIGISRFEERQKLVEWEQVVEQRAERARRADWTLRCAELGQSHDTNTARWRCSYDCEGLAFCFWRVAFEIVKQELFRILGISKSLADFSKTQFWKVFSNFEIQTEFR